MSYVVLESGLFTLPGGSTGCYRERGFNANLEQMHL